MFERLDTSTPSGNPSQMGARAGAWANEPPAAPNDASTDSGLRTEDSELPRPSPLFSPTPEVAARVAAALCDPFLSLADLAADLNVTLPALSLYIMRDDVREHLRAVESAQAIHTRLAAGASLPKAADALHRSLDDYIFEVGRLPWHPAQAGPRALEQRRRSRETANRAASLLVRFARFAPPPAGEVPSLRGGGGRTPESQHAEHPPRPTEDHLATFIHNRVTPFLDALDPRSSPKGEVPSLRGGGGRTPQSQQAVAPPRRTAQPIIETPASLNNKSTRTEDSGPRTEDCLHAPLTLNGNSLIPATPSPNSS